MPYRDKKDKQKYNRDYYKMHQDRGTIQPFQKIQQTTQDPDKKQLLGGVRLPATMIGRLGSILMESQREGDYLWKSRSDMIEDFLMRGIESYEGEGIDRIDMDIPYLRVMQQAKRLERLRVDAEAAMSLISKTIDNLLRIGEVDRARHYYWSTVLPLEEASNDVWHTWLLKELRKKYLRLAKERPKGVTLFVEAINELPPAKPKAAQKSKPKIQVVERDTPPSIARTKKLSERA